MKDEMIDFPTFSRLIPARTEEFVILWIKLDFLKMSQQYRKIRAQSKNPMDKCFKCEYAFLDDEMMALGCVQGKGNKVFCQSCANGMVKQNKEGAANG